MSHTERHDLKIYHTFTLVTVKLQFLLKLRSALFSKSVLRRIFDKVLFIKEIRLQ